MKGSVTNAQGQAVANASVEFKAKNYETAIQSPTYNCDSKKGLILSASAQTDAQGQFSLRISGGEINVSILKAGLADFKQTVTVTSNKTGDPASNQFRFQLP